MRTVFCLLLLAHTAGAARAGDLEQRIDRHLAALAAAGELSGTLLVAKGDEVLYEKSFGMASYELGVPNRPDTRFCVASINKPMTVAVFCRLAEQGLVSPQDPLARFIPEFPNAENILLTHLLNFRAGIPHRVTDAGDETEPLSPADMVRLAARAEVLCAPGEKSVYSSATYSVLARVMEIASGKDYAQLLRDEVCVPAGLERTLHAGSREVVADRASGYLPGVTGIQAGPPQDLAYLVGAGAALSTPRDLHRLMRAVLDGRLGEAAKVALIRETGFAWNGRTGGYRAFADYDDSTGCAVIFAGNLVTGAVDIVQSDVPRLLAGEALEPAVVPRPEPVAVEPAVLDRYVATYGDARGSSIDLRVVGGTLYAGDWVLVPLSPTTFFSRQDYHRVEFVMDAAGAVERIDWEWQDGVWPWTPRR